MGRTCSTHETDQKYLQHISQILKERDQLKSTVTKWKIIQKCRQLKMNTV
jgi:hypothetical protein